jgi:hypothetical protein
MSELNFLKRKFKQCAKEGFWLDRNTFLKSDDSEIRLGKLKGDNGKLVERPILIMKDAAVLTVNHNFRIISVERKTSFGVWVHVAERALETPMTPNPT